MNSINSHIIARNTLMLYIRMILLLAVNLYTSRVVLAALGIEDYGIYNVVGGLVALFQIVSGTLTATISRFITFALGKGDGQELKNTFFSSLIIQGILCIIVLVLAETVGLWFLSYKMVIPSARLAASQWVYQFSLLTFVVNLMCVPFNALIISYERMSVFAYLGLLEAFGKLAVAILISYIAFDKLISYSALLTLLSVFVCAVYVVYCKQHFESCTLHANYDHSLLKRMFGFAGWNFIGASSGILRDHGDNLLLNLFCGPTVNAARGISMQVCGAVQGFVTNFMIALNPQITKSFAAGEQEYMQRLVFKGARFSFFMIIMLASPVILCTRELIGLWLGAYPDHTILFIQLILVFCVVESLSGPLITVMLATGNIRNYQLVVGGLQLLNVPISFLTLHWGCSPESVMVVAIGISVTCLLARLLMLRDMIAFPVRSFLRKVCMSSLNVIIMGLAVPVALAYMLPVGWLRLLTVSILTEICLATVIYSLGCEPSERQWVVSLFKNELRRDTGKR